MWKGLNPPGNIVELTPPSGTHPVGLSVEQEAEEYGDGKRLASGTFKRKEEALLRDKSG